MLDGENFMKSGWIHSIKTHQFTVAPTDNKNYVIMGEVFNVMLCLVLLCNMYIINRSTTLCYCIISLGHCYTKGGSFSCSLYLHGRVCLMKYVTGVNIIFVVLVRCVLILQPFYLVL